ncbi:tubulin binding cofactor C-domain-containing protein [Podospora australis]|uniref:Tubulin binding cofactor C-domain-containing protein n=1 Tax=Podospora australis TaxID=1536484 RepID=A0AAN7AKL8_9PEZI|nr:tubulin binding cofactor C-domain-containing protein [Podospora australis]
MSSPVDPKERFYRQFQISVTTIRDKILNLPNIATVGGERQDAIENILTRLSRLSNEVADASDYVPAYDQRNYTEAVKALREGLDEARAKLAPKSRFQFKPRPTASAATTTAAPAASTNGADARRNPNQSTASSSHPAAPSTLPPVEEAPDGKDYNAEISHSSGSIVRKPSFSSAKSIAISNHAGLQIILPSTAAGATSAGQLTGLRRCIVDLSAPTKATPFSTLALRNIEGSLVVAGQTDGAVHITGVKNSVLVVVSRQVRIHECENVDLYLYCVSHPIIEDCKGLRFAPASGCYTTEKQKGETNQWDQVDDFKWLKAGVQSPNWSVLPEEGRILEEDWGNYASEGSSGESIDEVLGKLCPRGVA